jgi:hypothetical protein
MASMERGCLAAVLVGLVLLSGSCAVMAGVDLGTGASGSNGQRYDPAVLSGIMVFSLGVLAFCGYMLWRMVTRRPAGAADDAGRSEPPPRRTDADREREILRLAEHEHGRLTVTEVAARCDMTVAEAKAALDQLVRQQVAAIQVTQAGVLVYVFPGLLSDDDKAGAKDF